MRSGDAAEAGLSELDDAPAEVRGHIGLYAGYAFRGDAIAIVVGRWRAGWINNGSGIVGGVGWTEESTEVSMEWTIGTGRDAWTDEYAGVSA